MLGDDAPDAVKVLKAGEDLLALWQERQVADEDKVLDSALAIDLRHIGAAPDGLENHVDESGGDVPVADMGVARLAKERSRDVSGQTLDAVANVANEQVDVGRRAVFGDIHHLVDIVGVDQQSRQSLQRASAHADASNVLN